jgi:predicted O-linked N-acetylglucosamine transferase (SPINDLY family)
VVPLLEAHDHHELEVHCYSSVLRPDQVTERHRRAADVWHDVHGQSDHDLEQQIRADGIDILVDLTMHMASHRLLVFARKPAPVQVTWLAYPGSTGLGTMDYRLTDRFLDPPSVETPYYSEVSIHLPDCWVCYDPLTDEPSVNPLPAASADCITFGCLNNFCKLNDEMVVIFGKVLRAVEGSRLILLAPDGLSQNGVPLDRLEFVGRMSRPDYLKLHHRIDIALDVLPYNGITTTCDALWMGVPLVSLVGKTAAGRAGLGILSMVNLPELAATSSEEFVRTSANLAHDLPRLTALRANLRHRMQSSPMMDATRFARNIEDCYRTMWRRWCENKQLSPS